MGKRLLLADDSVTIQKVVAIIFSNEEYELTVVDNGAAALTKARELRPDVMLVDAVMPGKSGYEVCAEIRRDPQLCSIPILLLIGAFDNASEEDVHACGADASISKPFESQQLIEKVTELLALNASHAAPAATAPDREAAEALWGDLSSFDTMPPDEPAAPLATTFGWEPEVESIESVDFGAPAAPSFAEPSATFAAAEPFPAASPAVYAEEVVEATLEDDLWGAFEIEEAKPAAVPAGAFGAAAPDLVAEEYFTFEDESEPIEETGPAVEEEEFFEPQVAAVEESVVLKSDDELFAFTEDLTLKSPVEADMEPFELPEYEPLPFEPEESSELIEPEFEEEPVAVAAQPWAEPIPVIEPQGTPSVPAVEPAVPAAAAAGGGASFSEAELVAAISKVSREVIERIVWEVVPDLAEALIKEEIRKLKAGIRD